MVFCEACHGNIKKTQVVKYNDAMLSILLQIFEKVYRHVQPVTPRIDMVSDMEAIVESELVFEVIHALVGQSTIELY